MLAAFAVSQDADDPLAGLRVGDRPEPEPPAGWEVIEVRAATVNRHDLLSLSGAMLERDRLPMVLGTDAAGVAADGREVIAYPVLGDYAGVWRLPSEEHPGTLAERVALPAANLFPLPRDFSFEEAACLPTAYLTAYRMLFTCGGVGSGDRVLVQGASGGLATAAIALAAAAGAEVYATGRDDRGRRHALDLGATAALAPGERPPHRPAVVIETVGPATWEHSVASVQGGGRIVVAGATTGKTVTIDLERLYLRGTSVVGTSMGGPEEFSELIDFMVERRIRPVIAGVYSLEDARPAFRALHEGTSGGKIVVRTA